MAGIKLVIEDDKVTADAYGTKQVYPLSQVASVLGGQGKGITVTGNTDSGILPVALRWFNTDLTQFVFERPPGIVPIYYTAKGKMAAMNVPTEQKERYDLPFPWSVYVLTVGAQKSWHIQTYFRPNPVQSLDDSVCHIPIPNTFGNGAFCSSHLYGEELAAAQKGGNWNLADAANFIFNFLWTGHFNNNAGTEARYTPTSSKNKGRPWGQWLTEWASWSVPQALDAGWIESTKLKNAIGRPPDPYGGTVKVGKPEVNAAQLYSILTNGV